MLPHKSKRGRDAYHRLKVMVGAPEGVKAQKIPEASNERKRTTFTLTELCGELGKHMRKE